MRPRRTNRRYGWARWLATAPVLLSAGRAAALVWMGPMPMALPPLVAPTPAFPDGLAPGWHFATTAFVDAVARDTAPDLPTLRAASDPRHAALLAVGTVGTDPTPRRVTLAEAVVAPPGAPPLDAEALGVFDTMTAQSFANRSITLGGVSNGGALVLRFAGQVGASDTAYLE